MTNPQPEATLTLSNDPPASIASGNNTPPLLVLSPHTSSRATLQALIARAVSAKEMALHWQGRINRRQTAPYGEAYAQECVAFYQKQLVGLLTVIIAGDEPAIAAAGDAP